MHRLASRARLLYAEHLEHWTGSLVLLPACLYFALTRGEYTLLDAADLVIHEAGHFFFRFFGTFAMFAGGTLMQLILPSLFAWHFLRHGYRFGVQVALLWLGQNLINISVYAADARRRALPLITGDPASHDWWNMLGVLGMLEYDQAVGLAFYAAALAVFSALLLMPRFTWHMAAP